MRLFFLAFLFLAKLIPAYAQIETSKTLPADSILLEEVNALVRNYQLAVIKAARCNGNKSADSISIQRALKKFNVNATIEVTSLQNGKRSWSADVYFQRLINLCRARNYTEVDVSFLPDPIPWINITRNGKTCIVNKKIRQRFVAYRNGKQIYCDITLKNVHIQFSLQSNNTYKGLITKVTSDWTDTCE